MGFIEHLFKNNQSSSEVCVWVWACLLHKDTWLRPPLFLHSTSHSQSVSPSCWRKPSYVHTHSSEANMTKGKVSAAASGFMEVLMGARDVTRCNFLSNRTEWSKQPPNWMSYCLFSVPSPSPLLFFLDIWKKSWQISPPRRFLRGCSLHGDRDLLHLYE